MNRPALSALLVAVLAASSAGAQTQAAPPPRCVGADYHAFDFWIGHWTVQDAAGQVLGYNEIRPIAAGCGLSEHWRSARGGVEGFSLNAYDPTLGRWTQRWVGPFATLWLEGGISDGSMVLAGTDVRTLRSGATVLDRITWTALPDGRVRQFWEVAVDGGDWQPYFEGFYSRGGAAGGGSPDAGRRPRSNDF